MLFRSVEGRPIGSSIRCVVPGRRATPTAAGCELAGMRRWSGMADRMREVAERHGPEAVAFVVTTPSGAAVSDGFPWINRLIRMFGSPNLVRARRALSNRASMEAPDVRAECTIGTRRSLRRRSRGGGGTGRLRI